MRFILVALLALTAVCAEEISFIDIPKNGTAESSLRVRSLPTTSHVAERNSTSHVAERAWTSLSDVLDVFSSRNLVRNWADGKHAVGTQCAEDITRYIVGLKNQELWAVKGKHRTLRSSIGTSSSTNGTCAY